MQRKSTDEKPRVSICIPTYNRSASLSKCLTSVLNQDYVNLEIIITDNCSSDGTETLVTSLLEEHQNIRYIRNPTNIGSSANFNRAKDLATSQYFMWLADDDWISDNYVSACMEYMLAHDDTVMVSGAGVHVKDNHSWKGEYISILNSNRYFRFLSYYFFINDNSFFYEIINTEKVELLELENKSGNDCHFIAAIAYQGKIKTVPEANVYRSVAGVSSSMSNAAKQWGEPWWVQREPYLGMAVGAYQSTIRDDNVFGKESLLLRHVIGCAACGWLVAKKVIARRIYHALGKPFQSEHIIE